jgi:hypothetical protein
VDPRARTHDGSIFHRRRQLIVFAACQEAAATEFNLAAVCLPFFVARSAEPKSTTQEIAGRTPGSSPASDIVVEGRKLRACMGVGQAGQQHAVQQDIEQARRRHDAAAAPQAIDRLQPESLVAAAREAEVCIRADIDGDHHDAAPSEVPRASLLPDGSGVAGRVPALRRWIEQLVASPRCPAAALDAGSKAIRQLDSIVSVEEVGGRQLHAAAAQPSSCSRGETGKEPAAASTAAAQGVPVALRHHSPVH